MDNEAAQNLNSSPDLQNLPNLPIMPEPNNRQVLSQSVKIAIYSGIGLLVLVGLGVGGYYLLKNNNQPSVASPTPYQSLPIESPEASLSSSPAAAVDSGDYSFDADGFLWGTEAYLTIMENPNGQKEIDAINNTLKVKNIKVRLDASEKNPSNILCMGPNCLIKYDLDKFAQIFKENNWSMRPMFTPICANTADKNPPCTDSDIEDYVNYIDWFVTRYKNDANIKYIELDNAPQFPLTGGQITLKQLLNAQNNVYDRIKSKYPDIMVGTHGFEYMFDSQEPGPPYLTKTVKQMVEYFLDKNNGAKFDYWAFHGYPIGYPSVSSFIQTPTYNKYAGIPGILEIRKQLDANGWQNRLIIDTEHVPSGSGPTLSDDQDKVDAIQTIQELILKRTLTYNGKVVLSGITPLKIIARGEAGEQYLSSLKSDGSVSRMIKVTALLWSKLNEYKYNSHISGEFDKPDKVWIEKFQSTNSNKELYIFFKLLSGPASAENAEVSLMDQQVSNYSLNLNRQPKSATITDINGNVKTLTPSQTITLEAINSAKYLEVEY